jgi:hypothetical protein
MGVDNYIYIYIYIYSHYAGSEKLRRFGNWQLIICLMSVINCIYRNQNYTTWVFKINTTINIQKFNSKLRLHKCLNHQIYLNSKACWLWMSYISASCNFIIVLVPPMLLTENACVRTGRTPEWVNDRVVMISIVKILYIVHAS